MTTILVTISALAAPVAQWDFEGDHTDTIGGHDAVPDAAAVYGPGVVGFQAWNADGATAARVTMGPSLQLTHSLSVSAWVRPTMVAEMAVACRWGTDGLYALERNWCLVLEPDGTGTELRVTFRASSAVHQAVGSYEELTGTTEVPLAEWTHIAGTFEVDGVDTHRAVYVDGVLDVDHTELGLFPLVDGLVPIAVGARAHSPTSDDLYFQGDLDGVVIDGAVWAAVEVSALYDQDGDGLGAAADTDDDGDGVPDSEDSEPVVSTSCRDLDGDDCDDCSSGIADPSDDGLDTDADGVCDASDPAPSAVVLSGADVSWTTGAVGAPTVVYDSGSGRMVMVYETQTGTATNCPVGTWALGLATSTDGVTWTDIGAPLLAPTADTFYECVAAHPGLVDRVPGSLTLFFKGEQGNDACDLTTPSWGCEQYTGIGRLVLTWNAVSESYEVTGPAAEPALDTSTNFGYPKGVHQGGQYHVAYTVYPDMYVATGTTTLDTVTGPVWMAGDSTWADTELRSPSPACAGTDPFEVHVEGTETLGRLDGAGLASLGEGPGAVWSSASGDPALRHHDAVPLSGGGWYVIYDVLDGPGGTARIHYATTDPSWLPSDLESKSCP
jgi:hypothetical protein